MAPDKISDVIDKIRAFLKYKKTAEQNTKEYINGFDSVYTQAKTKGQIELPQTFLMYMLLENMELSDSDFRLVLTNIDFIQKETIYDQTKRALIKFFGSIRASDTSDNMKIIGGPDAYYNNNFSKNKFRTFRGRNRGYATGTQNQSRFSQQPGYATGIQNQSRFSQQPKKTNPTKFGKTMTCDYCKAITHLIRDCPEVQRQAYFGEEDEGVTFGYWMPKDSLWSKLAS